MICIKFLSLFVIVNSQLTKNEKKEICANIKCKEIDNETVCGIRIEGKGYRFRLFNNECDLIKYGCNTNEQNAYGLAKIEKCKKAIPDYFKKLNVVIEKHNVNICSQYTCTLTTDSKQVCGIKKEEYGYKVRIFKNICYLNKYNCEKNLKFETTDLYICNGMTVSSTEDINNSIEGRNSLKDNTLTTKDMNEEEFKGNRETNNELTKNNDTKNVDLIVVDASMWNVNNDINNTIDNFFAATHVFDLPMKELDKGLEENSRRMLLKSAGPIKVFKPWIIIPKNVSDDRDHTPTLSSCYHKCPKKCPDTYAPVCGVPGLKAQEPSLMFQNHCFMDVAQCKMYWENNSPTAQTSSYIESTFLFCLGDELNGLYRFLPLIKTLRHMGRLKSKGQFRHKIRNMRFFNDLLQKEPNIRG